MIKKTGAAFHEFDLRIGLIWPCLLAPVRKPQSLGVSPAECGNPYGALYTLKSGISFLQTYEEAKMARKLLIISLNKSF